MTVRFDYDRDPDRYRLGSSVATCYATASLHERVAAILAELEVQRFVDVGCGDGMLRAALGSPAPWMVGVDLSMMLLRHHPAPVVRADAQRLPLADRSVDAVTSLNVLYHLTDPLPALREAARILAPGGHVVVSAISRDDSPEFDAYWRRPATSFDAEEAPQLVAEVFTDVTVHPWDARLVVLPDADAVRDYLVGRQAPTEVARRAARELPAPLPVTKRGALVVAGRPRSV